LTGIAGVNIEIIDASKNKIQTHLEIRLKGLPGKKGPIITLGYSGLHRHKVELIFGSFSKILIEQIKNNQDINIITARELLKLIPNNVELTFSGVKNLDNWTIDSSDFSLQAIRKNIPERETLESLLETSREVVTPILSSIVELIGYEENEEQSSDGAVEGKLIETLSHKRERNPRNRYLCLMHHGSTCYICKKIPHEKYKGIDELIEVHHIRPLSDLTNPKKYNPIKDLIPLCPDCHRAIHKNGPIPYTPEELANMLTSE